MSTLLDLLQQSSALYGGNAPFIEELYERYLVDPGAVGDKWRNYFDQLRSNGSAGPAEVPHGPIQAEFARLARTPGRPRVTARGPSAPETEKQVAVLRLINGYRVRGHQNAHLDPLQLRQQRPVPDLDPAHYQLGSTDMEREFNTGSLFAPNSMRLADIIRFLEDVYCGTIGSEYMHITDTEQKRWIQKQLEGSRAQPNLDRDTRHWLLELLTAAEGMERYLHTTYVGQKRFSLEGAESLIPLLDDLVQSAGAAGIHEIVLGMAHRGRLNVLVNILGKPPKTLFREFEGKGPSKHGNGSGDVKYHQGFSSDIETPGGPLHLVLSFNPSHLEIINPVVEGSVRARQQRRIDRDGSCVLPVLIHGDAAFAGQGVVMETLNMSEARGFTTGGTVHILINNQIGFTVSNPLDSRSTLYCTDVAKMIQAPIFHVNADDPEAVLFVTRLALDFRMTFRKDVLIDMVCYRRHGHNEADEPAVTQPRMYERIRKLDTTRALYAERLVQEGIVSSSDVRHLVDNYREVLASGAVVSRPTMCNLHNAYAVNWAAYQDTHWTHEVDTGVSLERLQELSDRLLTLPPDFELHPRVARVVEQRRAMARGETALDWGAAEILAYASLLQQGYPVRLTGQDSGRGTFFHRHAILHDQVTGESYVPLQHVADGQANCLVVDSLLSEEAVLGSEYGYATAEPDALTLWEAQFGDFANGAQVVIDQFIVSGEAKWGRFCGLVMLLPHGYEGQGPEHSSARPERYLQLCAEHNIQVCVPTTPAQVFHMLRRQMIRPLRKPLIVMTSKSLLRHKQAVSSIEELVTGEFHCAIGDPRVEPEKVRRIVLCSGKVYYDLLNARDTRGTDDIALIRLEQLYPFPHAAFEAQVHAFPQATELVWCQEEPQNQGAWDQIKHRFRPLMERGLKLKYAGRPCAASPAAGYYRLHAEQQATLVNDALS